MDMGKGLCVVPEILKCLISLLVKIISVESISKQDWNISLAYYLASEIPPWLDAELQADIEAATGHDLGSERSKIKQKKKGIKGKAKGKKYPGLTDIKETNNTTRSRLEAKVFNRLVLFRESVCHLYVRILVLTGFVCVCLFVVYIRQRWLLVFLFIHNCGMGGGGTTQDRG